MLVKAAPGLLCPTENDPRKHILDTGPGVEVPDDSAYYHRLLDDGSLVLVKSDGLNSLNGSSGLNRKTKEAKHGK